MKYRGQLFKVQISYDIVHNGHLGKRNDCFVFKSKGRKTGNDKDIKSFCSQNKLWL